MFNMLRGDLNRTSGSESFGVSGMSDIVSLGVPLLDDCRFHDMGLLMLRSR